MEDFLLYIISKKEDGKTIYSRGGYPPKWTKSFKHAKLYTLTRLKLHLAQFETWGSVRQDMKNWEIIVMECWYHSTITTQDIAEGFES